MLPSQLTTRHHTTDASCFSYNDPLPRNAGTEGETGDFAATAAALPRFPDSPEAPGSTHAVKRSIPPEPPKHLQHLFPIAALRRARAPDSAGTIATCGS